ncbi:MAG: lipid biosynthesis B12-binding/radical SAM protein [Desulfocapsaceae bacterium]|nr:lipid biosynthesis B12-binding/radical SAM protein [Desulfocapsaceae bacterium]
MKILLISANTLTVPYPVYPIGLDYVAGAIGDRHTVQRADMLTMDRDGLAAIIIDFSPEIIGISCRNIDNTDAGDSSYFLDDYKDLVTWLRQRSAAPIVCGGSGFTIMPERILAELNADYGIIGEGERFPLLIDTLAAGRDPAEIPGVISKDRASAPPPPWPGRLVRRLPPNPQNQYYIQNGGMLNLQTKRGCSFRCIYCSYPHIEGGTHRLTDPGEVAETALQLQEAGAKYLFFTDSAFNSDVQHSLDVARALKKAGLSIPWGAFFAPVRVPDNYFAAMAQAGCKHVEFGTESLSDTVLRAFRKPFCAEDVRIAHRQAVAARIHVAHYLLFGGPQESAATVAASLDGIEKLEKSVFFLFIGVRIYPGTSLYDMAVAQGKIDGRTDLLRPVFYQPDSIGLRDIEVIVKSRASGHNNWVTGSGDQSITDTTLNLYRHGFAGPLWEFLAG